MFVKTFVTFFLGIAPLPARAGGVVLALVVAAIVLAAALCASSAAGEIDRAIRLSWWFS
ncbi:hypothetical protein LMG28688_01708 [Paraburkholderia caffeinitolerans]|uniref:Uncharacterized protein n=1 Tax=Paraburkholderia caffeinitolerans TaxID=1723730 RepID=A0A6J5FRD1_9BURK|nr:hypothetical protein [Paraburkholderia caffeinitolerans]CAB3783735.1 hypothetical protein LMG28688_01708 [Paraburkholderia caffeinitolerans]